MIKMSTEEKQITKLKKEIKELTKITENIEKKITDLKEFIEFLIEKANITLSITEIHKYNSILKFF
jgi:predicted  nucleic acid-binding Zn-ribbon protein